MICRQWKLIAYYKWISSDFLMVAGSSGCYDDDATPGAVNILTTSFLIGPIGTIGPPIAAPPRVQTVSCPTLKLIGWTSGLWNHRQHFKYSTTIILWSTASNIKFIPNSKVHSMNDNRKNHRKTIRAAKPHYVIKTWMATIKLYIIK